MKNREIAEIFEHMADILELKGDNMFRINSYRKASRVINDLTEDLAVLAKEGKLKEIPGIGSGMIENINQYLTKGKINKYEEEKKDIPKGLIQMLDIPGLGPKTASLVYKKLGARNISELEKVIKSGKLRNLPGMGEKKEENILRGIKLYREKGDRILLGVALPLVEDLVDSLKRKGIRMISPAGSLRRMNESIGDIDILVGDKDGKSVIKDFVSQPNIKEVLASGNTKGSVIIENGLQIDIRVVDPSSFGAALQYFTGSKAHNIHLREIAKQKGFKINEYGIFKGLKRIGGGKEEDIYKTLGLCWMSPLLREDRGEIEAAGKNKLPKLVTLKDIQGDLHVHSKWSDGTSSIEDVARAAKRIGYKYVIISDHSQSLKIAGGLSPKELEKQIEQIKKVNKKVKGITVLCGSEVDIKGDGSMDFPDKILEKLDIVIGAIHNGFKQDKKTIAKRITTAMKNPNVDIIAHPTGRLIGARDPYQFDADEILKVARDTDTALEINAYYDRLDFNDIFARKAKDMGVRMAIGTDSHHIDQLWMMKLGISVAQRGWLEKKDLLNTMTLDKLKKWTTKKR